MTQAEKDQKVLVLCGGKGERLKPLTESVPKPLVKIKGRPIISYLLSLLMDKDLEYEISGSKAFMEEKLLVECRFFAYPLGTEGLLTE